MARPPEAAVPDVPVAGSSEDLRQAFDIKVRAQCVVFQHPAQHLPETRPHPVADRSTNPRLGRLSTQFGTMSLMAVRSATWSVRCGALLQAVSVSSTNSGARNGTRASTLFAIENRSMRIKRQLWESESKFILLRVECEPV